MAPVHDEGRLLAHQLKAGRPDRGVEPVLHGVAGDPPASGAQHLHRLQHHGGVAELMLPQQGQGVGLALIQEALPLQAVKLRRKPGEVRDAQAGAHLPGLLPEDLQHALPLLIGHRLAAGLEDPGLLGGDLLQGVPQHGGVIQADVHEHGSLGGSDDVGGVQPAAQAHLQHHDVTAPVGKPAQGRGGDELKLRGVVCHGLGQGAEPGHQLRQLPVRNLLPVHLHPLVKAEEIGGGVKPCAIARGLENRGQHGRAAPLAVGAGDVDEFQPVLGPAQLLQQLLRPAEAGLGAEPLGPVDIGKRFPNVHVPSPCRGQYTTHPAPLQGSLTRQS